MMIEFRHLEWRCEELRGPFSSKTTIPGRNYFFKMPSILNLWKMNQEDTAKKYLFKKSTKIGKNSESV